MVYRYTYIFWCVYRTDWRNYLLRNWKIDEPSNFKARQWQQKASGSDVEIFAIASRDCMVAFHRTYWTMASRISSDPSEFRRNFPTKLQAEIHFGWPKTTVASREWRNWTGLGGFRDCTSRFQLRHRATWTHPRFLSEHELDHILIHVSCPWHVVKARVLQERPSVRLPGRITQITIQSKSCLGTVTFGYPKM